MILPLNCFPDCLFASRKKAHTPASKPLPKKKSLSLHINTQTVQLNTTFSPQPDTPPKRDPKTRNLIDLTPLQITTQPTIHNPGNQFRSAMAFIFNDDTVQARKLIYTYNSDKDYLTPSVNEAIDTLFEQLCLHHQTEIAYTRTMATLHDYAKNPENFLLPEFQHIYREIINAL